MKIFPIVSLIDFRCHDLLAIILRTISMLKKVRVRILQHTKVEFLTDWWNSNWKVTTIFKNNEFLLKARFECQVFVYRLMIYWFRLFTSLIWYESYHLVWSIAYGRYCPKMPAETLQIEFDLLNITSKWPHDPVRENRPLAHFELCKLSQFKRNLTRINISDRRNFQEAINSRE